MRGYAVQIDGWDPVADAPVSIRAGSHDEAALCHLRDDGVFWPAIARLPTLSYNLFDGGFGGAITAPTSSMALGLEAIPQLPRYALADARLQIWTGEIGEPWANWSPLFDGRVSGQPRIFDGVAELAFAVDDRWLDAPLLTTYAGTGGIEGPEALKGQPKPLSLGAARYASGAMIDPTNTVLQLSAYGQIEEVEAALDGLARFGTPFGDYANLAALTAAAIPPGGWATALSSGLVRHGAPPFGQLTYMVRGDKAGPDGWARRPGEIIRRIALLSGAGGRIDNASLDALEVARPWNLSIHAAEQTTARELIQRIAASVNAVAGVTWLGKLFVIPVEFGSPAIDLHADASALPPVADVQQVEREAPPWRLAIEAERTWTVHPQSDVQFTEPAEPGATAGAPANSNVGGVRNPDGSYSGGMAAELLVAASEASAAAITVLEAADAGQLEQIEQNAANVSALERARIDDDLLRRQAAGGSDRLAETLLRALGEANRTRTRMRDAGIYLDPASGKARIYGVDEAANRVAQVEVALDAVRAQISLRATVAWVQEQIALAVIDPSQIAELTAIIARITSAELAIDGLQASLTLKADAETLTALDATVSSLSIQLDALGALIETKAEQTEVDALATTVSSVVEQLGDLGDVNGIRVEIRQARLVDETAAEANLRALLAGDRAQRRVVAQAAQIQSELTTQLVENASVAAQSLLALRVDMGAADAAAIEQIRVVATNVSAATTRLEAAESAIEDVDARVTSEVATLAEADAATASQVETLSAAVEDQAALIGGLQQVQVDQAGSLAGVRLTIAQAADMAAEDAIGGLKALIAADKAGRRNFRQSLLIQQELSGDLRFGLSAEASARLALAVRMGSAEAALVTLGKAIVDNDSAATQRLEAAESRIDAATARIAAEETTRAEELQAEAAARQLIEAELADPATGLPATRARVSAAEQAIADNASAAAAAIEEVAVEVLGQQASIASLVEVVITPAGAAAKAMLQMDVNGKVSGVIATNDGAVSDLVLDFDTVVILGPDGEPLFTADEDGVSAPNLKVGRLEVGSVTTSELAPFAAQRPWFTRSAANVAGSLSQERVICSLPITKAQDDSDLRISANVRFDSTNDLKVNVSLYRGTYPSSMTLIDSWSIYQETPGANDYRVPVPFQTFTIGSAVPAGAHTFTLAFTMYAGNGAPSALAGSILEIQELKR